MSIQLLLSSSSSLAKRILPLPDWPEWALDVLLIMSALLLATAAITTFFGIEEEGDEGSNKKTLETTTIRSDDKDHCHNQDSRSKSEHSLLLKKFHSFRRQYVLIYLIIMLADWMQGTHMYTLYLSYGVNISALFLTGFLSGAIFAPFLGTFVDRFGRKRSCIVYCILEILINLLEHSTNMKLLIIGRILGGISTNLLFSSFESWMTTKHRQNGFPESWLSRTYSWCSVGNGCMAIVAGIVAQVMEDAFGQIGPFQGAIGLTCVALIIVAFGWDENYGEVVTVKGTPANSSERTSLATTASINDTFWDGWNQTVTNSGIWRIGLTQALSEGAMYTFVFMWVPTLLSLNPPGGVPTGCVFSSLMMSITIGGMIFPLMHRFVASYVIGSSSISCDFVNELCATIIYLLASASMAIPVLCVSKSSTDIGSMMNLYAANYCQELILGSFLVVELCVGLFMPVAGTLRSKYVPDNLQGSILNIFRLPLNIVVVTGTYATDHYSRASVFQMVSLCFFAAALLQGSMILIPPKQDQQQQNVDTTKKMN